MVKNKVRRGLTTIKLQKHWGIHDFLGQNSKSGERTTKKGLHKKEVEAPLLSRNHQGADGEGLGWECTYVRAGADPGVFSWSATV